MLLPEDVLIASLKDVGGTLEKEHAKDVLLELGGVHPPAEDVGRGEEMVLKLG